MDFNGRANYTNIEIAICRQRANGTIANEKIDKVRIDQFSIY